MDNTYLVTDSYNGEGYSSENGTIMKKFKNYKEAFSYAKKIASSFKKQGSELSGLDTGRICYTCLGGYQGALHVIKLPEDFYSVLYTCNLNSVKVMDKKETNDFIEKTKLELTGKNLQICDFMEFSPFGDVFINAYEDNDYQIRVI